MMLHDRGTRRMDFSPPRLAVAYYAPCRQPGYGSLIAGPANGHLARPIDGLGTRLR
jgi:hypothetical protein